MCRWIKLLRGVDGCAAGWLVVWAEAGSHRVAASLLATIAELALDDPAALTAIDIPIGLHHNGPRPCDQEARLLLGSRRSSVFPAPVRSVLQARSYNEACELSFQAQGRKLSKQTYNILAKIRAVDALLQAQGSLSQRLVEVHPELSFQQWNNGIPMAHAKKKQRDTTKDSAWLNPAFPERSLKSVAATGAAQLQTMTSLMPWRVFGQRNGLPAVTIYMWVSPGRSMPVAYPCRFLPSQIFSDC